MATLIIAEKNKAARAIAEALGQTKQIKKSRFLTVYHVPSKDIYVVPLRGHILQYENTNQFKSWLKSNPREIITNPKAIEKVPIKGSSQYINVLKEYSKICSSCIIGTDADVEGCNIGLFDALPFIKQTNSDISIAQIWLSSLDKSEIVEKYNKMIAPKWSWGEAGEARAIIDAIIGFSATREITLTLKNLLKQINKTFLSIGRVQTSLLYLIYLREDLIKRFVPEPYWTIDALLKLHNSEEILRAYHLRNPFKKENEIEVKEIYSKIEYEKNTLILNKSKNIQSIKPPTPLNTSKALVLLTRILKISANIAFETMNQLYLNQIISYPRTDSDKYNSCFTHTQYLKKFSSHTEFGNYCANLLKQNRITPTEGKLDAGDHPPITPIESIEINSSKLENNLQKKVYNILARHYLALFGEEAKESNTKLNLEIKQEPFVSRIVSLVHNGFLEIAPFLKKEYDSDIIIEEDAKELPIERILLNKKETLPPPKYTDTTLLQLMERAHLGTKSTRPVIIQILLDRDLIYRHKQQYSITNLGFFLIENIKTIWLPFLDPQFTGYVEDLLDDIKEKKKTMNETIDIVKKRFLDLFDKFIANKNELIAKVDNIQKDNLESIQNLTQKPSQSYALKQIMCPNCKKNSIFLNISSKNFRTLVCDIKECSKTIKCPRSGRFTVLNSKCKICGFNIFKMNRKKGVKSFNYYLCPNCWTEGLKKKIKDNFCSNCKEFKIANDQCVKK